MCIRDRNSIDFYLALRRAKVPAELHIYEKGKHGVGLGRDPKWTGGEKSVATWPDRLAEWMKARELLGKADAEDAIDKVGCRPDFGILVYPVIVLDKPYTHKGSKQNLLGNRVNDAELVEDLSTEKRVTPKTPPCFLMHTSGDTGVPPENSIDFYLALRKAKVPAELHIYEKGGHGFGLAPKDPVLSSWPDRLAAWMTSRGYLKKG